MNSSDLHTFSRNVCSLLRLPVSLGEEGYTTCTPTKATYSVQAVIIHCTVVSDRRKGSAVFLSSGGSMGQQKIYIYTYI